jgi:hypothetical protein
MLGVLQYSIALLQYCRTTVRQRAEASAGVPVDCSTKEHPTPIRDSLIPTKENHCT